MNQPTQTTHGIGAFVRSARILLAFQLAAAAVALVVTGWAALQVRPLFDQRNKHRRGASTHDATRVGRGTRT
jgi:hypothetical protein